MKNLTINPNIIDFLNDLKENNNRDWFKANQNRYEQAKDNFISFTEGLIAAIAEFDPSIGTLEAKECHFRIYRDVRFSKNKDPYKTNMGAYIARGGKKSPFAGYYFHIEPNASFVSGGIYMAQPNILRKIRSDIETYSDSFREIVENKKFKSTFTNLGEESLKKVPQGFSADSEVAQYLKLKHITPHHPLEDKEVINDNAFEMIVGIYREMLPLITFLNTAIEQE
ncbi:MAG: TIGR02453 family protein [Bacteroidetes bacterium HGW-Bacteroidetes-15]|nr:MAG: TIGR02453 family protein [Bacteroidetes bacterium HGW-Bacteroidetes-15]